MKSAERKRYKNELNAKVRKARREAFLTASVKEAKLMETRRAKKIYNPVKVAGSGGGMSPEARRIIYGGSMGGTAPQSTPRVKRLVKKVRKRSKKKPNARKIIRRAKTIKPASTAPQYDIWSM